MPDAAPAPTGAPSPTGSPVQPNAPQQGNTAAAKPGETAAQTEARRLKLRIGGQEQEFDESEVAANFEKGRNSAKLLSKVEQRRQEALQAQAKADGILGRITKEPLKVLRELGVDVRALSERTILDEIELEKMTPAERRAYDAEQKLKAFEDEKQAAERQKQEAAHKEEVAKHQDEFANLFMETLSATGLPKESARFVAYRMAHLYAQNEQAGLESTPQEMAEYVMEGVKNEHRAVLSGLKGPALLEHLGPDVVKEVLRVHLDGIRQKRGVVAQPAAQRQAPQQAATLHPRRGKWDEINQLIKG